VNKRMSLLLLIALVAASCGGDTTEESTTTPDDGGVTTTAAPTTTVPATTTTAAPTTTVPATTTTAPAGPVGMIPDPPTGVTLVPYADENITAGDVFLYWYREDAAGNYLAIYAGPGIAGAEGLALCPGNSIAVPDFRNISNTPVEDGSCEDFPTDTSSVQVCSGGVWIYRTAIPADLEGTLFGSLEWTSADGSVKGLTSQFVAIPDLPTFEYGLSSYSLWDGFTSDGSSEITCSNPMT